MIIWEAMRVTNNNFNHSIAEGYFVGQVYEVINGISVPIFNY